MELSPNDLVRLKYSREEKPQSASLACYENTGPRIDMYIIIAGSSTLAIGMHTQTKASALLIDSKNIMVMISEKTLDGNGVTLQYCRLCFTHAFAECSDPLVSHPKANLYRKYRLGLVRTNIMSLARARMYVVSMTHCTGPGPWHPSMRRLSR